MKTFIQTLILVAIIIASTSCGKSKSQIASENKDYKTYRAKIGSEPYVTTFTAHVNEPLRIGDTVMIQYNHHEQCNEFVANVIEALDRTGIAVYQAEIID